ncbi:hypothetical protein [Komagataeibacter rhaeticus]|uniref:Uncharacterized protein n=1 Tax=Komagataeibacter rhaeticus TaxID=215221 RepID=A0A181C9K4_9PROT|nr:hypothetical protein [Komagataeibacter rhaeticus]QIP35070.1 hypothetical protein GWK63_05910 [Komagataeibacter rhaeticus]QOC47623.1 hypothetical protein ICJ78_05980 [Komagataeibacter rhaeticus]WPP23028.1 hypothetical protein SCD25_05970 [Komagataeibacter rhaeticus]SAY48224.1 hypothetical protein KRIGEM_01170 [Komagataeibacter rhaeticus]
MKKIFLCTAVLAMTGCASNPSDIGAQYVSPEPYLQQSCAQLAHIDQADTQDLASAEKHQRRMHQSDEWGVALIGVPVGSIGGDRHKDIGRLKGELDAIHTAERGKNCVGSYSPADYNGMPSAYPATPSARGLSTGVDPADGAAVTTGSTAARQGVATPGTTGSGVRAPSDTGYSAPAYSMPAAGYSSPSYSDNPFR